MNKNYFIKTHLKNKVILINDIGPTKAVNVLSYWKT